MQLNSFMKKYYCIFTLFYTIALFCSLSHFCRRYTKSYSFIWSLIVPVCKVSHQPVLGLSLINKGITVTWFNWKFWPFLNIVTSKATIRTPYSSCVWWGCPTLTHISYCCSKLCDTQSLSSVISTMSPISVCNTSQMFSLFLQAFSFNFSYGWKSHTFRLWLAESYTICHWKQL